MAPPPPRGKKPRPLTPRRASDARGAKGHPSSEQGCLLSLGPRTEGTSPAPSISPTCPHCPSNSKDVPDSPSVRASVGLRLNALKAGIVFCVCVSCVFFEILLTSGFRLVQNSLKKKEATGYFSCHKVTSHTEEMNNIRKTDPGYQKSSVS